MKLAKLFWPKWLLIGLVLSALWIIEQFGFTRGIRGFFGNWFSDARKFFYSERVKPVSEADQFKKELSFCLAEKIELEEENSQARRLLDAGVSPTTSFLLAKVVGASEKSLIVSVEDDDEVKEGASLVSGRIFLGKVEETGFGLIRVQLAGSTDLKVPAKIWSNRGEAVGEGMPLAEGILMEDGGRLVVDEILSSTEVAVGNLAGTIIETGEVFLLGEVVKVFPSKDKVFQKVELKRLVDLASLLTVGIIKD